MSLLSVVGKSSYVGRAVGRGRGRSGGRIAAEALEGRVLLSGVTPSVELFDASAAVFVENQGQWADQELFAEIDPVAGQMSATDFQQELVIDPDLAWSTYLGGGSDDHGNGIAVDGSGNVLVTGYTASSWISGGYDTNFWGDSDAFVAKLSPSGEHLWSTYLGGSDEESGYGIAVDGWGNVLVTGWTGSYDWASGGFDTSFNEEGDAFVVKLSPSGEHLWSTYLGGSDGDYGYGIAVDGSGNVLVTGWTNSVGWTSGGFDTSYNGGDQWGGDAFVAKLSPSGAHLWSSYLGGGGDDLGRGIAADGSGNVVVTGWTNSVGWTSGGYDTSLDGWDAFVVKLSDSGGHLWSTYVGGSGGDDGQGIAVDGSGNVLVTGRTGSSGWTSGGFDTSYNGGGDAFVAKLSDSGGHLWSTYVGGSSYDKGDGIAVDGWGNVLVTGETFSSGWTSGGFDTRDNGGTDGFVAKLSPSGEHLWSTYLGGSDRDSGDGIAVDGWGNVLVTGETESSGWTSGGFDTSFGDDYYRPDAFVVKIGGADDLANAIAAAGDMVVTILGSRDLARLHVGGQARVEVAAGVHAVVRVEDLYIGGDGVLDVNDNELVVGNGSVEAISALIRSGRAGGAWTGHGITSSAAKGEAMTGLAVMVDGQGDVVVKHTWEGDANVDGVVNADDYFLIDSGLLTQESGYYNGDFNYDGVINADDYCLIDGAFLGQGGPLGVVEDAVVVRAKEMVGVFATGKVKRVWEELSGGRGGRGRARCGKRCG